MNKNNDGTNHIIEKDFVCGVSVSPIGKELERLILVCEHALKNLSKKKLSCKTLIDTVGLEDAKTLGPD